MAKPPENKVSVLDAKRVTKQFGAVIALRDASLTVNRGEIVALMGANGAGKSTFVKILTGALKRNSGEVQIRGRDYVAASPTAARKAGLISVYQEPSLIPDLDIHDNLRLSNTLPGPFRDWMDELGITTLSLDQMISDLPLATLRIIDLARALAAKPDILLLDEMTAALPTDLVARVLKVVRSQADVGMSVIYVSHRFSEIAQICNRATILRDGATVGDVAVEKGIEEHIVELMLGEALEPAETEYVTKANRRTRKIDLPRLNIKSLSAGTKLTDISFCLERGEVLGVVALEGQGQDELFNILAGVTRPTSGTVEVDGHLVGFYNSADAIAAGLTFVPGNRASALLMSRSVHENVALPLLARLSKWGIIPMQAETFRVNSAISRLQIDTRAQGEVRRLSGGNQQKVTIARWIARGVETLLLFDPTRGIDVRTKKQIYTLVRELANQGAGILFYTSELAEISLACDRVIVIFGGRVVSVMDAGDATEPNLMRAAYGLASTIATETVA